MEAVKYYISPSAEEIKKLVPRPFESHPMYQKAFSWLFYYISLPFFMIVLVLSVLTFLDGMYHVISDRTVFTIFGLSVAGAGFFYLFSIGRWVKRIVEKHLILERKEKIL